MVMTHPSNVYTVICQRRSIRSFKTDSLPRADLEQLKEALRWAPSAGNRQPWHFYVVLNQNLKNSLAKAAGGQEFLSRAPVVFVICAIPEISAKRYSARGRDLYVYQDTAAAVQNLLLASTALGYGSCWVGAFDEAQVSRIMDLPAGMRPVALVPLGIPGEQPSPPKRKPIEELFTVRE